MRDVRTVLGLPPADPDIVKRFGPPIYTEAQVRAYATAVAQPAGEAWRPEVRAFADLMEAQLRANDHKPGWKRDYAGDLMDRLREEASELSYAITGLAGSAGDAASVGREAADVANFAMMIADVCGALPPPAREPRIPDEASDG